MQNSRSILTTLKIAKVTLMSDTFLLTLCRMCQSHLYVECQHPTLEDNIQLPEFYAYIPLSEFETTAPHQTQTGPRLART